jgi:hypothetical protein
MIPQTLASFFDELEKVADSPATPPSRKKKLKKLLKNTALVAGGYGAGELAGHLTDAGLRAALGSKYTNWSTPTKKRLVGMGMGLTGAAALLATAHMTQRTQEAQDE